MFLSKEGFVAEVVQQVTSKYQNTSTELNGKDLEAKLNILAFKFRNAEQIDITDLELLNCVQNDDTWLIENGFLGYATYKVNEYSKYSSLKTQSNYKKWLSPCPSNSLINLGRKNHAVARKIGELCFSIDENIINNMNNASRRPVIYMRQHKKISPFKYVGQTRHIWDRSCEHIYNSVNGDSKEGMLFSFSLQITDPGDWQLKIIEHISDNSKLNERETLHIVKEKTYFPYGLNMKIF